MKRENQADPGQPYAAIKPGFFLPEDSPFPGTESPGNSNPSGKPDNGQAEKIFRNISRRIPPGKIKQIIKANGHANGYAR